MELVLGVAVADSVARLALVDEADPESVLDRFEVGVAGGSTRELIRTISDTDRALRTDGHQLKSTNICWADQGQADTLRTALAGALTGSVSVVSPRDAATALVRTTAGKAGQHTSALLLVDESTAALSVVGPDAANTSLIDAEALQPAGPDAACEAMLERLREEPGGSQTLYVMSTSGDAAALTDRLRAGSPIPLHAAAEPAYLLARGAAMAHSTPPVDLTPTARSAQLPTAMSPVQGQHLAYSLAPDSGSLPIGVPEEYDDSGYQTPMPSLGAAGAVPPIYRDDLEDPVGAGSAGRPRILLMGSTIAAIVVVGFAVLAVGVAISIKPTVSQQAIRDYEAVPGKYGPIMPGQGIAPVEDAATYQVPVVPVQPERPEVGTPAVYSGGNGPGYSGSYSPGAGSGGSPGGVDGTPVVVSGGGASPVPGNPGAGTAFDGLALAGLITGMVADVLPDQVTFHVPASTSRCNLADPNCILEIFQCWPTRPGCKELIAKQLEVWTKPKTTDPDKPDDTVELNLDNTDADPVDLPDPADRQRTATTGEDTQESESSPEGGSGTDSGSGSGSEDTTEDGDATDGPTDGGSAEAPVPPSQTSTTVTTSPPDEPTTESSSVTTPPSTTSAPPEPKTTTPTTRSSTPAPVTTPERVTTSDAPPPPPPPAPKPAPAPIPEQVVEAPPAPAPPPVVAEAPAPEPPPVVVEAPAPEPPPVVVEAPAPEPIELPSFELPSSSSGSGSSSSDSGSGSSSDSSDSSPVTTEVLAP